MIIFDSSSFACKSWLWDSLATFSRYSRHIFWSYTRSFSPFLFSIMCFASCMLMSSSFIISIKSPNIFHMLWLERQAFGFSYVAYFNNISLSSFLLDYTSLSLKPGMLYWRTWHKIYVHFFPYLEFLYILVDAKLPDRKS